MRSLVSNPYFQLSVGSLVGFAGSVVANLLFYGRVEKKRAQREAQRAYNKLMMRLVHTTISDINHPLHLLPLEISDRIDDLKFALEDVNPKFEYIKLVQQAIVEAADLRKKQEEQNRGQTQAHPGNLGLGQPPDRRHSTMDERERRNLVKELAGAVSTQAQVTNRSWLYLITAALFAVLPRVPNKDGNLALPFNVGEVVPNSFHVVAFLFLVVLTIYFAAAHAQQIRAQKWAQSLVDSLVAGHTSDHIVHPRELFDMLRLPSLNRIAPLAQLLRGRYQYYATAGDCPDWLRIVSVSYYLVVKVVSVLVFFGLPVGALWRAYRMVSLTGWWRVGAIVGGCVAGITLLQVLLTDAAYSMGVLRHLWKTPTLEPH